MTVCHLNYAVSGRQLPVHFFDLTNFSNFGTSVFFRLSRGGQSWWLNTLRHFCLCTELTWMPPCRFSLLTPGTASQYSSSSTTSCEPIVSVSPFLSDSMTENSGIFQTLSFSPSLRLFWPWFFLTWHLPPKTWTQITWEVWMVHNVAEDQNSGFHSGFYKPTGFLCQTGIQFKDLRFTILILVKTWAAAFLSSSSCLTLESGPWLQQDFWLGLCFFTFAIETECRLLIVFLCSKNNYFHLYLCLNEETLGTSTCWFVLCTHSALLWDYGPLMIWLNLGVVCIYA